MSLYNVNGKRMNASFNSGRIRKNSFIAISRNASKKVSSIEGVDETTELMYLFCRIATGEVDVHGSCAKASCGCLKNAWMCGGEIGESSIECVTA